MRDFWRGEAHVGEFAQRLTGSSDLYQDDGRHPFASINFITAHDGFTLADLVSYNDKHNEANKEDNRDGTDDNRSWNCGVEGPTDDPEILALRARQQRNFLATLLLSQGTPMLLGGDEFGRTQGGNNNGWCQDSEISWFDWALLETNERPARVHAQADRAAPRARRLPPPPVPVRARDRGLRAARRGLVPHADGERMRDEDWGGSPPVVGVFLNGEEIASPDSRGRQVLDESFLLLFNAHHEDCAFTLPEAAFGEAWTVVFDTAEDGVGGRRDRRPATRSTWSTTRWCCCAASRNDGAAGDVPAAAGRGVRLRRGARELVPVPARPRRLAPLPAAVLSGARGLDARLRRRRPGARSPTSSAARRSSTRWWTRCARRGPGDRARHRPEPHGDRRRQPLLGATASCARKFFDIDEVTGRHRRFFDVDHLAGVRQEDPEVFEATHALALRLVREGVVDGLRIDHPDGLADPAGYLQRLRDGGAEHVWVEKILDPGEQLRDWPVDGTVGYEFLNDVCGAVRRPGGRGAADRPVGGDLRRRPALRRARLRGQARAGADDVRAGGRAAAARRAARA